MGFALILLNAAAYILNTDNTKPILFILGVMFLSIGMMNIRKSEK